MDINKLPNNSAFNATASVQVTSTPAAPQITPVIKGEVKKKTALQKIGSAFIAEDVDNIKEYLLFKVAIPTIKASIINSVSLLFTGRPAAGNIFGNLGGTGFGSNISDVPFNGGTKITRLPYEQAYNNGYSIMQAQDKLSYDEIVCMTREDAENLIRGVLNYVRQNNIQLISIKTLYLASGQTDCPYTYNDWGWRVNVFETARPTQLLNGRWSLGLPSPISFKSIF